MNCGIYKITNKVTGKSYIGRSIHIEKRWKEHLQGKGSVLLHQNFGQYGINNFTFEILELCNEELLNQKEEFWIKHFDTYNNGYNQNSGGDNVEHAVKVTKKSVYCYDLNGRFMKEYDSLCEAERQTGIGNSLISRAIKTNGRTKNYQWRDHYLDQIPVYIRNTNAGSIQIKGKKIKAVEQYTLDGKLINSYISISQASKITKIAKTSISEVCRNKRKTAGGYVWKFKE